MFKFFCTSRKSWTSWEYKLCVYNQQAFLINITDQVANIMKFLSCSDSFSIFFFCIHTVLCTYCMRNICMTVYYISVYCSLSFPIYFTCSYSGLSVPSVAYVAYIFCLPFPPLSCFYCITLSKSSPSCVFESRHWTILYICITIPYGFDVYLNLNSYPYKTVHSCCCIYDVLYMLVIHTYCSITHFCDHSLPPFPIRQVIINMSVSIHIHTVHTHHHSFYFTFVFWGFIFCVPFFLLFTYILSITSVWCFKSLHISSEIHHVS